MAARLGEHGDGKFGLPDRVDLALLPKPVIGGGADGVVTGRAEQHRTTFSGA
jgi:hypothetical protein